MKVYEIGTGYTPIPATMGAATEIVVEELTKAFQKLQVPVEIIDIKASDRKPNQLPINEVWVPGCFAGTDVKLGIMHKLKRVVYSICLAQKLKKVLRNSKEKVVLHFHNQYNMFFFLKLVPQKLRERAVLAYTVHSGIWSLPWEKAEDTLRSRYFQEAESIKRADVVFILNQATKENVIRQLGVNAKKLYMIKNGVNPSVYYPLSDIEKEKEKAKRNLSGKKIILQVGSVYENKGQAEVIELLAPLMKRYPDLVYLYVGSIVSEEYQQKIMSLIQQLNLGKQVIYAGTVTPGDELNRLYNSAEFMIVASEYEAFPLVTIEALSAGVPILINEAVHLEEGEACIYYSRRELEEELEKRIKQNQNNIREAARNYAVKNYSWEVVAAEYISFLNI